MSRGSQDEQTPQKSEGDLLFSAFRKVAEALDLSLPDQAAILGVPPAVVAGWRISPSCEPEKTDRMALFVWIYGLDGRAFPGDRGAMGWLQRGNTAAIFGGASPLNFLLIGRFENLQQTYDHLHVLNGDW